MSNLGDLIRRWQPGWARARGFAAAVEERGALHVPVGEKGRQVEVVVLEAGAVAALAAELADDHWLTVPTTDCDGVLRIFDDAGLTVLRTESLMSRDLRDHPAHQPPAGYAVTTSATDGVITTRITCDGEEAASGMMPLVGTDAVAHNIVTSPSHRRRGLASAVKGEVQVWA